MKRYLLIRGGGALGTLFLASIAVFVGVHQLPGDPAVAMVGQEGANDPELLAEIRRSYQLDRPLPVQYFTWLGHLLQGDLGNSIHTSEPVLTIIAHRIPITLELAFLSLLFAVIVGVTLGVVAALRQGKPADLAANVLAFIGISLPGFWVGLLLIALFAIKLQVLPASGFVGLADGVTENLRHLILPAFVLGSGFSAVLMMQTRSSVIETLGQDFVRTARAKGLSEAAVILRHVLRNSLLTIITILGLQMGVLIGGSVVTEQIFLIPGFGKLIVESVGTRDYPVIQAVALVTALGYVLVNFFVDVLYTLLNPRVRLQGGHE